MSHVSLSLEHSLVVVVDVQDKFMRAIQDADRVMKRSLFLAKTASILGVPVIATEQNPEKMGLTSDQIQPFVTSTVAKMTFSCALDEGFVKAISASGKRKIILVGAETHICICLSALHLLQMGYEVVVCPDALSSRSVEQHKLGMERMRDAGVVQAHTETVLYEWIESAQHPKFKEILAVVKELA